MITLLFFPHNMKTVSKMEPYSKTSLDSLRFYQRNIVLCRVKQSRRTLFKTVAIGERDWTQLFWNKGQESFYTGVNTSGEVLKEADTACVVRASVFAKRCSGELGPIFPQRLGDRGTTFLVVMFQGDGCWGRHFGVVNPTKGWKKFTSQIGRGGL